MKMLCVCVCVYINRLFSGLNEEAVKEEHTVVYFGFFCPGLYQFKSLDQMETIFPLARMTHIASFHASPFQEGGTAQWNERHKTCFSA